MTRIDDGIFHLQNAKKCEENKDYFGARVEFIKAIESFRQAETIKYENEAKTEFSNFAKKDPFYNQFSKILLEEIQKHPGILQSEITKRFDSGTWADLYVYDRLILKDDIYYVLRFAEEFNLIEREKTGRSYKLYPKTGSIKDDNE